MDVGYNLISYKSIIILCNNIIIVVIHNVQNHAISKGIIISKLDIVKQWRET